jgi:hypothetical protein
MAYNKPRAMTRRIASGSDTSAVVELLDGVLAGFSTPAALDTTSIKFEVCHVNDGTTFLPLYDSEGNEITLAVTTSRAYSIVGAEADALAPWPYVQLIAADGNESGDRDFVVVKK